MTTSPPSDYNYGQESEWLTQEIASIRFLADFAFANPKYKKAGLPREFADLLVVVGDTLLVFQVKSHLARPQSAHDEERMHRKIMKAFRQFRVLIEAISDRGLTVIRNKRDLDVPFDLKSFKEIFFVIVLHYIREADAPSLSIRSLGFNDANVPINIRVFEANDFFFLAHQFDTVPDFAAFLNLLLVLELRHPQALGMNFADLLAFMHLYRSEVLDLFDHGTVPPHLRTGIYQEFERVAEKFEFPESYVVDDLLSQLHTAVGAKDRFEPPIRNLRLPSNSIEAYWESANALANTSRVERHHIAQLLARKRRAAVTNEYAYGAYWIEGRGNAVLVHSSHSSRRDRIREVGGLALALHAKHELKSVLGIAAPPGDRFEDHDVLFLRQEWIPDFQDLSIDLTTVPLFAEPRAERI